MTDWGVPDWQDAGAYPKPDDLFGFQWWWEFTRRRPDYRSVWEDATDSEENDFRWARDFDAFSLKFELGVVCDPRRTLSHWALRHYRYPRAGVLHSSRDLFLASLKHASGKLETTNADRRSALEQQEGIIYCSFDLSRPLGPQLDRAKIRLEVAQEAAQEAGRPDVTNRRQLQNRWPTLLRVLDARDAGATFQQITDALHPYPDDGPEPGWASDMYRSARQLRDNFPL